MAGSAKNISRVAQSRADEALVRAVTAHVRDRVEPQGGQKFLARRPDDECSPIVYRGDQVVGTTGGSGWADHLAQQATTLFLASLGPQSAAAQLLALALDVPFTAGLDTAAVAGVIPQGAAGGFVEEGEPIPVTSFEFSAASLRRKKLALIAAITRELAKGGRAEKEIGRVLREAGALTLDAVMFSADAATDAAPAGLFYGVTETAFGGFDQDPTLNALLALTSALTPIGGERIAFVTSPTRALQIAAKFPDIKQPVLASNAIADDRIAGVALDALAVAIDPGADIEISQNALFHMNDEPAEIVAGDPATADPVRSTFQTATLGIRLILELDWAQRADGAVAFQDGLGW